MVNEAKKNEQKDREVAEKINARNNFNSYLYEIKKQIKDKETIKAKLTEEEREDLKKALKRANKWFKDSSEAASREDLDKQQKRLESIVSPLIVKAFGEDINQRGEEPDDLDSELDDL